MPRFKRGVTSRKRRVFSDNRFLVSRAFLFLDWRSSPPAFQLSRLFDESSVKSLRGDEGSESESDSADPLADQSDSPCDFPESEMSTVEIPEITRGKNEKPSRPRMSSAQKFLSDILLPARRVGESLSKRSGKDKSSSKTKKSQKKKTKKKAREIVESTGILEIEIFLGDLKFPALLFFIVFIVSCRCPDIWLL
jgi:hypothetical protein